MMKIIKIKDYYGKIQEVPVSDELYKEWIKLNNETQENYHKEKYHRSFLTLDDVDAAGEINNLEGLVEELFRKEQNTRLYEAISQLTPIQQRRVMMFMDNMNYSDIARSEGIKFAPIYRSLQAAFKKLRTFMRDYE